MDNKGTHFGIVDGLLGFRLPGGIGSGVVRIDADDVKPVEIFELAGRDIGQLAAKHEMQQLLLRRILGHRHSFDAARGSPQIYGPYCPRTNSSNAACRSRPAATSTLCTGSLRL